jgi:hypothetical protein
MLASPPPPLEEGLGHTSSRLQFVSFIHTAFCMGERIRIFTQKDMSFFR